MARPFRSIAVWMLLVVVIPVSALQAGETSVASETSLRSAPDDGKISAFVTAGTPVDAVERDGDWVRVRLEGWVRADVLADPAATGAPAAATPSPAVEAPPAAALVAPAAAATAPAGSTAPSSAGALEGLVQVKQGAKKKKKAGAAGAQVMLLPAGFEPSPVDPEAQAELERIEAHAEELRLAANKAMHMKNFSQATHTHDDLMKQRKEVLAQRLDILAARHGRHEAEARRVAVTSTLTDAKGWYSIADVAPGDYTVYTRMTREDLDVEWVEPVTVAQGSVRQDLDDSNALGLPPSTKKK